MRRVAGSFPTRLRGTILLLAVAVSTAAFGGQNAGRQREREHFDVVINGGRVLDPESGLDAVRNVGITGGKIAAISTKELSGRLSIDARGLIVSPGFIDLHSHAQQLAGARMQALDGVTTALELEGGTLPIGSFYERVAREGRPINFGTSVSWVKARQQVMDGAAPSDVYGMRNDLPNWSHVIASDRQIASISKIISDGLDDGGLGIGFPLGHAKMTGRKEFFELAQMAARRGVPVFVHTRFLSTEEPQSSFEAAEEAIAVAAATGVRLHICHINSSNLRDGKAIAAMLRDAQARHILITAEAYPYSRSASAIGSPLFKGPRWRERLGNIAFSDLQLGSVPLDEKAFNDLQHSAPDTEITAQLLRPGVVSGDQELLDEAVLFPGGAIASDSVPWTIEGEMVTKDIWPLPTTAKSHPRSAGTFSHFLMEYVRQRQSVSLLEAVRKLTLIPAQIVEPASPQMAGKGRIQIGADADIDVFDLSALADKATFSVPAQPSVGMRWVLVAGVPIIANGQLLRDQLPGKPIRGPVRR
jgi:N-acyl-D-glutamate deacylase